jgi:hypothetical protein
MRARSAALLGSANDACFFDFLESTDCQLVPPRGNAALKSEGLLQTVNAGATEVLRWFLARGPFSTVLGGREFRPCGAQL